ncbi:hypothetical protein WJX73_002401 [Symbiochloris irregularis]|uniref:Uncharacterized protein n=1 Tax=Symbiochloris irregularis TaxID=706552 RepID=A0AAW1PQT3_9CHLO
MLPEILYINRARCRRACERVVQPSCKRQPVRSSSRRAMRASQSCLPALYALVLLLLGINSQPGAVSAAAPSCLATTVAGARSYGVFGTASAILQQPSITRICPGGGIASIEAAHASVPNIYYTGTAQAASTSGVVSGLRIYCNNGLVMYEDDLPASNAYLATKTINDAELANDSPIGTAQEFAPVISSYNLSSPSALWLSSDNLQVVSCPANSSLVGVTTAAFYGGIDSIALICAPSCYNATMGSTVQVNGAAVVVGTAAGAATVSPPPSVPQSCSKSAPPVHVGPGFSYLWGSQFAAEAFSPQQPIVTKTCQGTSYIIQWDVRAFNYTESYTGLRIASIGARCSDGSLLDTVPSGTLADPLGDVYFTAKGQSGVNDASGWSIFPYGRDNSIQFGFAQFMEVGGKAEDFPAECEDFCPEAPTSVQCPPQYRAIGYTAAGFNGGGIDVIDVSIFLACALRRSVIMLCCILH